jgi:hypothetical protein
MLRISYFSLFGNWQLAVISGNRMSCLRNLPESFHVEVIYQQDFIVL